jgi:hypothetical protein
MSRRMKGGSLVPATRQSYRVQKNFLVDESHALHLQQDIQRHLLVFLGNSKVGAPFFLIGSSIAMRPSNQGSLSVEAVVWIIGEEALFITWNPCRDNISQELACAAMAEDWMVHFVSL